MILTKIVLKVIDHEVSDVEGDTKRNSYYLFDDSDTGSEEENIRRRQKRMSSQTCR